jgi:hypothetical protein
LPAVPDNFEAYIDENEIADEDVAAAFARWWASVMGNGRTSGRSAGRAEGEKGANDPAGRLTRPLSDEGDLRRDRPDSALRG